jgi:predicted nucleic acid-binding protein
MEWVASLRGKTVGLDTAPIICFIEGNPLYVEMMRSFFLAVQKGEFAVVTSTITLLETLVVPLRHGNSNLAQQYRAILLRAKGHTTISLYPNIAEEAARLRASYNIRTPDSIQMATAIFGEFKNIGARRSEKGIRGLKHVIRHNQRVGNNL